MKRATASVLLGLILMTSGAFGQQLPTMIREDALKNFAKCEPPEKTIPPEAVTTADFNGDGKLDYVIEYTCSFFCGTGGCTHDIWISREATWSKEFSNSIRGIEKRITRNGRSVFLIDLHGSACKRVGAEACPRQLRWDGTKLRLERRN